MLIQLLIALIVIGAVLYILNIVPIDARIKQIITVLVIVFIAIWAIQVLLGGGSFNLGLCR